MITILWSFLEKEVSVNSLGEHVAYSWTCGKEEDPEHEHVIECLWVWHNCDQAVNEEVRTGHWSDIYLGWTPTGVAAHDLISSSPLHIEASVYWPYCCGMHGFIRNGKWEDLGR